MEENQSKDAPSVPSFTNQPAGPPPKHTKRWVLTIVGALLLVSIVWVLISFMSKSSAPGTGGQQNSAAEQTLDDMFAAAAAKKQVRLTYAEQRYESRTAFEAKQVKSQFYSVAELNLDTKDYRAVYAKQLGSGELSYAVRRCLDEKMYRSDANALAYQTLDDVKAALAKSFTVTVADGTEARDCSLTNPDHPGRLTDGVIPIGLNKQQTEGWLAALYEDDFLQVADKGMTTYGQKSVRKIQIASNSLGGAGNFFTAAQNGAGLQLVADGGDAGADAYRLDHMATSDNVSGFYLIDEATKLPVYSEFTTAALLGGNNDKAGSVMKQAYAYPDALTLNQTSTINTLE
jgi:hypothetical protein